MTGRGTDIARSNGEGCGGNAAGALLSINSPRRRPERVRVEKRDAGPGESPGAPLEQAARDACCSGFFASLSPEQQCKALAYRGDDSFVGIRPGRLWRPRAPLVELDGLREAAPRSIAGPIITALSLLVAAAVIGASFVGWP